MTLSSASPQALGFIGLGMMGFPMAQCLVAAGRPVHVFDGNPDTVATFTAKTDSALVTRCDHATAVAEACDVIIMMLPNSVVVSKVIEGSEGSPGILDALRPGSVVVDMGSSLPTETSRLADRLSQTGASLIDAPVSGSVAKAKAGTLSIMVGGSDETFAKAEPILKDMSDVIVRTGVVGSAHAMKGLNNYVYAAGLLAAVEALVVADRMNLDTGILTDVLNASSGRNVATETKLRQFILPGTYGGGFQLGLMRKDIETAGAIAASAGVDAPLLQSCRTFWSQALEALGPTVDNLEIHRFVLEQLGRNDKTNP